MIRLTIQNLLGGIALCAFVMHASAADSSAAIPYTLVLSVTVSASADGKLAPSASDTLVVLDASSGVELARSSPSQQSSNDVFQVVITSTTLSQGAPMTLSYLRSTTTYKLVDTSGNQVRIPFNGGQFLPNQASASAQLPNAGGGSSGGGSSGGGSSGGGSSGGGSSGGGSSLAGDINGDGKVDQLDAALLKQALSGKIPTDVSRMDVNRDKVINTRDLIDLLRALRATVTSSMTAQQSVVNAAKAAK